MKIRIAQPGDEHAIAEVHVNSWRTTYAGLIPQEFHLSVEQRRDQWKLRIEEIEATGVRKVIFVAENQFGEIFGFASGGEERSNHREFDSELYAIYLEPEAQNKGAGSKLTLELGKWLHSLGFIKMRAWVLGTNPSRRFYEKIGGQLLPDTQFYEFGGKQYAEVAYGFELVRLIEVLAVREIGGK